MRTKTNKLSELCCKLQESWTDVRAREQQMFDSMCRVQQQCDFGQQTEKTMIMMMIFEREARDKRVVCC